jgi:glycosyltransferase involved in cell wall biosynthesis
VRKREYPMKVVQVCPFFYPVKGGMERYVFHLSEGLLKLGHSVQIVTSDRTHNSQRLKRSTEVFGGIPVKREKAIFQRGFFTIFPSLWRTLKKTDHDLIHIHAYRHPHTEIAARFAKKYDKKIILTPHGTYQESAILPIDYTVYYRLYDMSARFTILKKIDGIIALTNYEKEMLIKRGANENSVSVVPPIIPINVMEKTKKIELPDLQNKFVIGYISRIHRLKGLDFLIKSLSRIKDENWALLLAGKDEGCLEDILKLAEKEGIREKVRYLGYVSEEKKQVLLNNMNLFVLPTRTEGFGIALLEAQRFGVPCIATDVLPLREVILDGKTGFLVPYGDTKLFASRVETLIQDEKLRKRMSKNAEEWAKKFSWMNVVRCVADVYQGKTVNFYADKLD